MRETTLVYQHQSHKKQTNPYLFLLIQVLPGLEAGIKTMSRGQVAKIEVPSEAAYGTNGYPPIIPPNAILFFEVELISFSNIEAEKDKTS
jgi:FKBP-type peptidyl-prolyl cis-trans isomerase